MAKTLPINEVVTSVGTSFYVVLGASQILVTLAGVLICVWMGVYGKLGLWSDGVKIEFKSHPILMTFGLIVFYTEAILIYRVFPSKEKFTLKIIHAILQGCAVVLVAVALKAIFYTRIAAGKPNLHSFHGWIGIGTVGLFCCQFAFGFTGFLWPGFIPRHRAFYLSVHVFFGSTIFIMAIATALLGIAGLLTFKLKNFSGIQPEAIIGYSLGITLILLAMSVMYLVLSPKYKRDAQIEASEENQKIPQNIQEYKKHPTNNND